MRFVLLLVVAVIVALPSITMAQTWAELYTRAQQSYGEQKYEEALTSGNQALLLFLNETTQKLDNHAAILRLLQNVYYDISEYEKGLVFAEKEVSIRESDKSNHYAEALNQVGYFHQALGVFPEAEKRFSESLEILRQFYKPSDTEFIETQLNLGISVYEQGKNHEAHTIFKNALQNNITELTPVIVQAIYFGALLEVEFGSIEKSIKHFEKIKNYYEVEQLTLSADYANVLYSLANCFQKKSFFVEAEREYGSSQKIYEELKERTADYYRVLNARAINLRKMGKANEADAMLSAIPVNDLKGEVAAIVLTNNAVHSQANSDFVAAEKLYRQALTQLDKSDPQQAVIYQNTLQNLAIVLSEQENASAAMEVLNEGSVLFPENQSTQVSILIKKGMVLVRAAKKDEAEQNFKLALKNILARGKQNSSEWVMAMNGLGTVKTMEGNILSADSIFTTIRSSYQQNKIPADENYPIILSNYASVLQMQGKFNSAYDYFFQAARLLKNDVGTNSVRYATTLDNLAHLNINRGAITTAKTQIDSALTIFEGTIGKNSAKYASGQITLGRYYQAGGLYPLAEPCFKIAYNTYQQLKNTPLVEVIRSINALAIFYQTMGNYESAEPLFRQSLARIEKSGATSTAEYSTTMQNLATLYQVQGKNDLATPLLEKSLAIDQKVFGDSHPQYAIALKNLGVLYQKQGKFNNAQVLLERALQVTELVYGKDHASYAVTVSNLAALYQDQGKYKEAERAWKQSVALRKKLLGEEHPDYIRSLYGLANIQFAQGDFEQAALSFNVVTAQYLKQVRENFASMSEKEKGAFYLKIKPVFEAYQDFCVQFIKHNEGTVQATQTLEQLYNIQLETKAILLNSSAKVREQILASNNAPVISAYNKWLETKETIGRYYTLTADERKGHENIKTLQEKANDLEKELSISSSAFRDQNKQRTVTVREVQNVIQQGEAAVEIIRIKKKFKTYSVYYVGLVLKKDAPGPTLVIWPDGANLENRFYKFHRNSIKFTLTDSISYKRFWQPLASSFAGINHIYLSCDGIFNKVNLSTLENHKTKRWVIDDFTISLVSNTKELLERKVEDQSLTNDVHLYGNIDFNLKMDQSHHVSTHQNALTRNFGFEGDIPLLPGTGKEVDEIAALMAATSWKVASHTKSEASESSIKEIQNPKILHIATHGFFMNDIDMLETEDDDAAKFLNNPLLRSGVLFAGAGVKEDDVDATAVEDGILTAYEAMNLTLDHTDLVVMSACETGLGEIRNGEGVYGLQRSFLVAGASAVMMSLWQVDDNATQELMVEFYKRWMTGEHKLKAFREAQLKLKDKYKSPYYWGAFIMVGY